MSMLNAVIISDMSIIIFIIKHPHHSGRNVMLDLCLTVLMGEPGRLCVGDRAGIDMLGEGLMVVGRARRGPEKEGGTSYC